MKRPTQRSLPEITREVGLVQARLANIGSRGPNGLAEEARKLRGLARELDAIAASQRTATS